MKKSDKQRSLVYFGPSDEISADEIYQNSFYKLSYAEKLKATWEMVETATILKGGKKDDLRLQRSVAVFKLP